MINLKNELKPFFTVESEVIDTPEIFDTIYEAHLYITLCRFCNNQQVTFPSYKTLADYCFCSKRTIIKALNGLVEKGLVKKVQRYDEETKTYQSNSYIIQTMEEYMNFNNKNFNSKDKE